MAATTKSDGRPDPASLVAGHATSTLSEAERRRLYRAALDDQEVFDRLVEEEQWRRIFDAPGVRGELLAALAEPPGPVDRLRGWLAGLARPVPLALGTAAAALLVAVLVPRWLEVGIPGPITPAPPPGVEVRAPAARSPAPGKPVVSTPAPSAPVAEPVPVAAEPVAAEPVAAAPEPRLQAPVPPPTVQAPAPELVPKTYPPPAAPGTRSLGPVPAETGARSLGYTLELNRPGGPVPVPAGHAFRPGDQFRLRLGVDFTAWLYLFNRAAGDDSYAVLYPQAAREREPRPPSSADFLLPAGVWLTLDDTPEDEQLILVVTSAPWPAMKSAGDELPAAELDAALARAEGRFRELSWRRSETDDRVRWTVADPGDDLMFVVRLLAR